MSSLIEKLDSLETRIQSLIEGGTTRFLPRASDQTTIGAEMVAAMKSNIRTDESGKSTAPDLYILKVDRVSAQLLVEDPGLVEEGNQLIYEAGTESGVRFNFPPRVKISADTSLEPGRFEVTAQFSLQEIDETSTLMISKDDGYPIPEYAFLIINGVQIFPLNQQVVNLGRRVDNHVVIEDLKVSRVHAQIRAIKGHYVIFDLDSSGGTFVNGVRSEQTTLYPGDVISLAGVDLVYGQDAAFMSNDDGGSTQPLVPFPEADD
jgi:hypothetical protein